MRGFRFAVPVLAVSVLALTGCGNVHENKPRPPIPAVVSVTVDEAGIDVSPAAVGEPGERGAYLNQNRNAPQNQADRAAPLVTRFAIANLTPRDTRVALEGPAGRVVPLVGSGSADFTIALPTGTYRLSSPVSTRTTRLAVGSSRISSGSDVLVP